MKGLSFKNRITALLLILVMLFCVSSCTDKEEEARMLEYELRLAELTLEKQSLINEKRRIQDGIKGEIGHNCYMSFVFLALDSGLYDDVYPIFSEGDIKLTGVMALSEDELPGSDGNITVEQYAELTELGWDTALYWKGTADEGSDGKSELTAFLEAMRAALAELEIDYPASIVFEDGAYLPEYDGILEEYGLINVLHDGSNEYGIVALGLPEGIWRSGIIGWRDLLRSTRLKNKIESGGGYASFKIVFDNSKENSTTSFYPIEGENTLGGTRTEVFVRMVNIYKNSIETGNIHVVGIGGARAGMEKYYNGKEAYLTESKIKIAEIDVKIKDVERRMSELYDEYF